MNPSNWHRVYTINFQSIQRVSTVIHPIIDCCDEIHCIHMHHRATERKKEVVLDGKAKIIETKSVGTEEWGMGAEREKRRRRRR